MHSEQLFFSIIIPAQNEEKYIEETLRHIAGLKYPADRFEVLVIENGSTDGTLALAEKYAGGNITVISSNIKGVSPAKNMGASKCSSSADWTIFLDADTVLKEGFLSELNAFLKKKSHKNYSIGTTEVKPIPNKAVARAWFAFYDVGHRLTKASYSIQIVRTSLLKHISFDDKIAFGEDIVLIRAAMKHGKFFLFRTKNVYTSTRRFDNEGWMKVFLSWTFVTILPIVWKRRLNYKAIR